MTSFSMRALLPVSFLIGLGSGCSHRNKPVEAAPASAPTASPNSTVTSEDIAKAPGQSIEQVLMGRFPGVEVTRTPDGGFAVRIRGGSSIRSGNTPLYVLDGGAIDPRPNRDLTRINPNAIESIEVDRKSVG